MNFIKLISFNIDTNLYRYENSPQLIGAMPNWQVSLRSPHILYYLEKSKADIICLQELRKCNNDHGKYIDSITPFYDGLKSRGYEVLINAYNPYGGDRSFRYLTAYNPDKFSFVEQKMLPFTKSGTFLTPDLRESMDISQIKDHNFGATNERGASLVTLKNKSDKLIRVINVHMDIPWKIRKESSRILGETIANKDVPTISVGDYNSFPDWNGDIQCDIITETGNCKNALSGVPSSFIAFPYDWGKNDTRLRELGELARLEEIKDPVEIISGYLNVYKKECDAIGGRLDNVFHSGFSNVEAKVVLTPLNKDLEIPFEENAIKSYVLAQARDGNPAFASDHQLIEVFIEL